MKKNNKEKIRKITTAGVLLALILVFLLVPMNFTGIVDLAVVAIIAVLLACQYEGFVMGMFCGLTFGLASLISSFTTGSGALLAPAFHNPLISILPRLIVPITTYFSYIGMRKLFKTAYFKKKSKKKSEKKNFNEKHANRISVLTSSLVSSVVGVTTNTALVMSMLYAFHAGDTFGNTVIGTALLISVLSVNFPIELAVCAVATPSIVLALKVAFHKTNDKYYFKNPTESVEASDQTVLGEDISENIETECDSASTNEELSDEKSEQIEKPSES